MGHPAAAPPHLQKRMTMMTNNCLWAMPEELADTVLRDVLLRRKDVMEEPLKAASFHSEGYTRFSEEGKPGVAVVSIDDVLVSGESGLFSLGYATIRERIRLAAEDSGVDAILLSVDSPGGMVSGCQELAFFIAETAKKKPMAAFTGGIMASAAYWLGSATGRVYSTETASVGSIGVIMTRTDYSQLLEREGIKINVVSSGRYKAAGHPALPFTDDEQAYFQSRVSAIHGIFRREVAESMGLDEQKAEEWGDAQLFLAADALRVGLVSAVVSGIDEAITRLSKEVTMDRATLETQHPELLRSILEEGAARAVAERSFTPEKFLACVRHFMTQEEYEQAEGFFLAGAAARMTPDQMEAMAASMVRARQVEEERAGKAAILAGLQQKSSPVAADMQERNTEEKHRSALLRAAENM